jgi:hypothetical protein
VKIAICVPHYGDVAAHFAYSLAMMVGETVRTEIEFNGETLHPEVQLFFHSSAMLPELRNNLIRVALDWGANFLLFADADHTFPSFSLLRLLSLNLPVVGVNYPRRAHPHRPTACGLDGELIWTMEDDANNGAVVQVKSLGLGFCLIDRTVFDALANHAESTGNSSIWPLFAVEQFGGGILGEDLFFFRKLAEANVAVYLDHGLSWSIGHVSQRVLTNADAGR